MKRHQTEITKYNKQKTIKTAQIFVGKINRYDAKKVYDQLSLHDILEILNFIEFEVTKETKQYDLFGKIPRFSKNKIFNVFVNLCFENSSTKKLYFSQNIISLYVRNTSLKFKGINTFPKLLNLCIKSSRSYVTFMENFDFKINKQSFPKLQKVSFGLGEGNYGSMPNNLPLQRTILEFYPSKIENDSYLIQLNDKNINDNNVKDIKCLDFLLEHTITGIRWKSLINLKELYLCHCKNFSNDFFRYQDLTNLKVLEFTNCPKVTGRNWCGCKNLIVLRLRDCINFETTNIINFKLLEIVSFRILHQITIPKKDIEFGLNKIKTCYILRYNLSYQNLKDIKLTLKTLYIENVNTIPTWPFMQNLTDLRIREGVNKICIFDSFKFPSLKILILCSTPLSCKNIDERNFSNIKFMIISAYSEEENICDVLLSNYKFPSLKRIKLCDIMGKCGYGWKCKPQEITVRCVNEFNQNVLHQDLTSEFTTPLFYFFEEIIDE